MAKNTNVKKNPPAKKRRRSKGKIKERVVSVLFVLLIFIALAIAFDYILFSFKKPPLFAVKTPGAGCTEHVGLIYIVSDYQQTDANRPLEWEWIWNKFHIVRVD